MTKQSGYEFSAYALEELAVDFKNNIPQVTSVSIGRKIDKLNVGSWRVSCGVVIGSYTVRVSANGKDLPEVMLELTKDVQDALREEEQKQSPTIILHVFSRQRNTPLGTSSIAISRHRDAIMRTRTDEYRC